MPHRLEIALKPDLSDAEGENLRQKAQNYFGIELAQVRTVHILTIDADLTAEQLSKVQTDIFTNPVTQISSFAPLPIAFDWCIRIGYRPGVKDNAGDTAVEAIEDTLGIRFNDREAVYTSKRYCLKGNHPNFSHDRAIVEKIAGELLANDIIQQWDLYSSSGWDSEIGVGFIVPKVILDHKPAVLTVSTDSDAALQKVSDERNLALNPKDIPTIRSYFANDDVRQQRAAVGLSDPTDIELEYISQARSDHCNHNTFQGRFFYRASANSQVEIIDNLFDTCIKKPTLELKEQKDWVISVLWDNAGAGRFDDNHYFVITGETHNSPSNMEAYGGAITGIVGVYRDPLGTGKGAKLVMGGYGYCTGPRDYSGSIKPHLHPRRLLDGVIEGVRDGGNKSGIPTVFGQVLFDDAYIGKSLVFVTAAGIMPAEVAGSPAEKKRTSPGDLVIMCGGRVGKDGIHGVTASSESFSADTPAGHVQIGDPYTQKKMHDFLLEVRDEGLIQFITDNGGGGLSSSVGESALFSDGCAIQLEKVPLKYQGLDQWEIWISESQERMTVAIKPEHWERFHTLSEKHAVESTVIGQYTDTGKLHITYNDKTCAYIDLDFLSSGFPQWEFDAQWQTPADRGLYEPVISSPANYNELLTDILARPNVCSKEWVIRQYDHEVQGSSVIKPLVGAKRDMNSDAVVIRPVLDSEKGLAYTQALLPWYSAIDARSMACCTIDEAVRRLIAVGTDWDRIGGVDNFCWPDIQYDSLANPDGKFKAAQLVRACMGLKEICTAFQIPLLSGKDSMYADGHLSGSYNETHKISAPETLQFSCIGVVANITQCVTMDSKQTGDRVYVLGITRNELGGSEYYAHFGYTGMNVPEVYPEKFSRVYKAVNQAIRQELAASVHGIYRGGLGIHLAMTAMGGDLGMNVDLGKVTADQVHHDDIILFSETPGRFIVTVDPVNSEAFEALFNDMPYACIGEVTGKTDHFIVNGADGHLIVDIPVSELRCAWKRPFGALV
ncbi:phosphoribosylformylglycinamidine synthase subunit PurS [Desulfococcaceae bacterium HSG9]|nr:phosphoribosylformylglycinamidine synthase subunit PurS [Desulfococcaceae bacterium HSG9]